MKRINSELIEVVDPTGTYKLWLKPELIEYAYEDDKDTIIVGIKRDNLLFIPNGLTEINQDDKLIFMGTSHSLDILD